MANENNTAAQAAPAQAAQPAASAQPNPAPAAQPAPATDNNTAAQPAATPQQPAAPQPDAGKKAEESLLGGAATASNAETGGNAEPKPDGGKQQQPGDGQPQDPYKDLKLADGVAVDEAQMANFKALAKENGLSAQAAQAVLDFEAQRLTAAAEQAANVWKEQTQKEYGDKLPTVLATAARAVDKFGGAELRELLNQTGLGNHPVVVKTFHNAGALLREDASVPSNGAASADVTFEQAMYGK